ncbi:circumsporozoite protein- membrane associated protein [Rhodopirellula baltica]|nr:circumsporozoite protein- membrane associated protein [Rhodopirellula baltica]
MSTATSSTKKQPGQHRGDAGNTTAVNRSAAEQIIDERIEEARRALWWSEITRAVLKIAIGSMAALLAWLVLDHWIYSPGMSIRVLAFAAFLGVVIWYFVRHTWPLMTQQVTSEYAAWALENDHPDYRQQLTSYVTLKPESPRGVRARVVQAIGTRAATLLKTHDVLPGEATGTFKWWIAAASLFALLAAYIVASPKSSVASTQRLVAPFASIAPAKRVAISNVTPGNTQTLAGRSVAISAEVKGLFTGEAVTCRVLDAAKETTLAMEFDEATDRFKTSLAIEHTAVGQQQYWIEACDAVAGPFQIAIENVPVVAIERVRYQPPAYTDTQPRTTSSPAIQALDATTVTIHARVNRPVARAEMQLNCKTIGDSLRATGGITKMQIAEDGVTLTAGLILRSAVGRPNAVEPVNYRIQVWDQSEQTNPDPIVYPIKVIPDLPPDVTIVVPRKSPKEVPDNSQQTIEVHAMDADFELERVQLKLVRGLDTLAEPVIWKRESNGKGNQVAVFRFRPFLYRLRPGDVVRVTATAIDNRNIPGDPRIRPNTVTTDPVELRIVEDDPNLPQDPTDNDGLSTPDKQPASDVNQSEAGEGQSSSGSGGEGGESGGEQSGNSGSSGGESSGESSAENQPNNENPESNGQPDQNPSDGNESDGDEKQSSGESGSGNEPTGNPSGSEGKGEASSNPQDPSSAQQPNRETNSDQSSSDQTGEGEADPNGQPSPNGESDPQGQGQSSANEATPPGQSDNSQSSSDGGTKMSGSDTETGSESNSADGLQSPEGSQQPDGSQQDGSSGESDSSGKSAPEHDGEAFERIKDYLERQKNKPQSDGKQPSSPQSDSASGQESDAGKQPGEQGDQPSSQQGKQESTGSESSAGDQSTSGENSQGGESGSENGSESGSDAGSESGSDAGQETGGEESGSESGSETGSDAGVSRIARPEQKAPTRVNPQMTRQAIQTPAQQTARAMTLQPNSTVANRRTVRLVRKDSPTTLTNHQQIRTALAIRRNPILPIPIHHRTTRPIRTHHRLHQTVK